MGIFGATLKDQVTTIAALIYVIVTAVQQTLAATNGDSINWFTVLSAVVVAVIGYFTGKSGSGAAKVPAP